MTRYQMNQKILPMVLLLVFLFSACQDNETTYSPVGNMSTHKLDTDQLLKRAVQNLDSTQYDLELLNQDLETYKKYPEVFQGFPLNKSPFPVAEYDYAVSSIPFDMETDSAIFKGVRIGEYETTESETIVDKLTLLVLTNDKEAELTTLVESRNYPYLTAQGFLSVSNNKFDWVFSASPDGFSTLLLNMKLFDLRFGETVIIYPQIDGSFLYDQLQDSPNTYMDFDQFKKKVIHNPRVINQLKSHKNIRKP